MSPGSEVGAESDPPNSGATRYSELSSELDGTRYVASPRTDAEFTRYKATDDSHQTAYRSPEPCDVNATSSDAREETSYSASAHPRDKVTLPRRFGEYELIEQIAKGGMGVVYKAKQLGTSRLVALKMVLKGSFATPDEIARFETEARAAATLDHPGIVPIYQIGEAAGLPFYTMAFVGGGSLHQLLANGPLPPKVAANLVRQLADAVQYAHERGILHRDIKPQNVLLQRSDTRNLPSSNSATEPAQLPKPTETISPRLTDFGLARFREEHSGLTATGEAIGTPSYMPPEQAIGDKRNIGPAADIYSLGAVLYATLTGRPPFQSAGELETLRQVKEDDPLPPRTLNPGVPRDLQTICLKCLEKQVEKRYRSSADLALDLNRFLSDRPIHARTASSTDRLFKWIRRRPAWAAVIIVSFLTVTILLYVWRDFTLQLRAERDKAKTEANIAKAALELVHDPFDEPIGLDGPAFRVSKQAGLSRPVIALLKHGHERIDRQTDQLGERFAMLNALANAYCSLGVYEEAERHFNEIDVRLKYSSGIDPLLESTLHQSIGHFHHVRARFDKGDHELAQEHYQRALDVRRKFSSEHANEVCETMYHMAWLALDQEKDDEATAMLTETKSFYERSIGYTGRLYIKIQLAAHLFAGELNLFDDFQEAIDTFANVSITATLMPDLVNDQEWRIILGQMRDAVQAEKSARSTKDKNEAAKLHSRAVQMLGSCDEGIRQKDETHFYRTIPLVVQGIILQNVGDLLRAEAAFVKGLWVLENSVGLEQSKSPVFVSHYAKLLVQLKRADEAHQLFQRVFKATKERFGESHFNVANAQMVYADFLREISDWKRLEKTCAEAKAIYDSCYGERHRRYKRCVALLSEARGH